MKKLNKKGFTIVELVIVIAVIAILAAVLIPTFAGVVEKANKSATLQEARNFYTEVYADDIADGVIDGTTNGTTAVAMPNTNCVYDHDATGTAAIFTYTARGFVATLVGDEWSVTEE